MKVRIDCPTDFLYLKDFMKKHNINKFESSLCYPWGEFNNTCKKLFKKFPIKYGLTVIPGSINKNSHNSRFFLPRYDTNYFR